MQVSLTTMLFHTIFYIKGTPQLVPFVFCSFAIPCRWSQNKVRSLFFLNYIMFKGYHKKAFRINTITKSRFLNFFIKKVQRLTSSCRCQLNTEQCVRNTWLFCIPYCQRSMHSSLWLIFKFWSLLWQVWTVYLFYINWIIKTSRFGALGI